MKCNVIGSIYVHTFGDAAHPSTHNHVLCTINFAKMQKWMHHFGSNFHWKMQVMFPTIQHMQLQEK